MSYKAVVEVEIDGEVENMADRSIEEASALAQDAAMKASDSYAVADAEVQSIERLPDEED